MPTKVIQWATGPVGRSALQHIIDNPDLELVGLYAHSEEKKGADAGTLVDRPDTGVLASTDRGEILALDADVVVYTPRMAFDTADMDRDVLALLRSGKNVVTPAGYWYPPLYGGDYVDTITAACDEGDASLFGAGENPGFFLARLATTAASACAEVNSISLAEFIDCEHHPSAPMIFDVLGFGRHPGELEGTSIIAQMLDRCFHEELALVGHQLGAQIDDFSKTSRFGVLDHDIELAIGPVKAGTVVAQAHRWTALSKGVEVMSITNTWFVHPDVPGWDLDDHWLVTIDGRPGLTIDTRGATSLDRTALPKFADTDSGAMDTITAMTAVNAIPRVCAAPPGIVYPDTSNLPALRWAHLRHTA